MNKAVRSRYTLEFKQEAVRLVHAEQSIAAAARTLGVVEQTLFNWIKVDRRGPLKQGFLELIKQPLNLPCCHGAGHELVEPLTWNLQLRCLVRRSGAFGLAWHSCSSLTCYASNTKFLTGSWPPPGNCRNHAYPV